MVLMEKKICHKFYIFNVNDFKLSNEARANPFL